MILLFVWLSIFIPAAINDVLFFIVGSHSNQGQQIRGYTLWEQTLIKAPDYLQQIRTWFLVAAHISSHFKLCFVIWMYVAGWPHVQKSEEYVLFPKALPATEQL